MLPTSDFPESLIMNGTRGQPWLAEAAVKNLVSNIVSLPPNPAPCPPAVSTTTIPSATVAHPPVPTLSTAVVQAHSLKSTMTSFIGPMENSQPDGSNPSRRLQRRCPICFPAQRPAGFDK
jgi:hypothetical protein